MENQTLNAVVELTFRTVTQRRCDEETVRLAIEQAVARAVVETKAQACLAVIQSSVPIDASHSIITRINDLVPSPRNEAGLLSLR